VRHLAWLHASPAPRKPPSLAGARGLADQSAPKPVSRLQRLLDDGAVSVELPPVPDGCAYLVTHLFDIGPAMPSGMGPAPLSAQELLAWQSLSGVPIAPWESRLLRDLSRAYLAEFQASGDEDCPSPWQPAVVAVDTREVVAARIRAGMRGFMAQQQAQPHTKRRRQ
jgi:hypothetical protein